MRQLEELSQHRFDGCRNQSVQRGFRAVYAVRCRRSVSGTLRRSPKWPISRKLSYRRALRPTGGDKVHRNPPRMTVTMPALRVTATDGPQSLRLQEIPIPQAGNDEVLVRVRAAALNHRDVFITQGKYPRIRLPVTLGSDGVGETPDGARVVIDPMLDWGDDPRVWDASKSSILGMPRDGTFARYVVVPRKNVHPKPSALSFEEAAAIPLGGLTAYRATFTRGALRAGETVLIPGIGGGVATFVLLFAKHVGARAIVTSSSDEKLRRARELGADLVVNYRTSPDWAKIGARPARWISSSTPQAVRHLQARSTRSLQAAALPSTAVPTATPRSPCFRSSGNTSRSLEARWEVHTIFGRCWNSSRKIFVRLSIVRTR